MLGIDRLGQREQPELKAVADTKLGNADVISAGERGKL